jgi:hypothetical protein
MKKGMSWIKGKHKKISDVLVVLLVIVLSVIAAGFIPFSNQRLQGYIERMIQECFPGKLTFDNMTIALWTGISIKKVHYVNDDGNGSGLSCLMDGISISYYVVPLIFRHFVIKNIKLEHPDIAMIVKNNRKIAASNADFFPADDIQRVLRTVPYSVIIRSVSLNDAHIVVSCASKNLFECHGLYSSIKLRLDKALSVKGIFHIDEISLPQNLRFTKFKMTFRTDGNKVDVDNCRAFIYGGNINVYGSVRISDMYITGLDIDVDNIKIGEWYNASAHSSGKIGGRLSASMKFMPGLLRPDSLLGRGKLQVKDIYAVDLPFQNNLFVFLLMPKFTEMKFRRISSGIVLEKGRIYNENCKGYGDPIYFAAEGWIGLDGNVSENIKGTFTKEFVSNLSSVVRKSLLPVNNENDRRAFEIKVSGSLENPHCSVDERIQQRAVNNVFDAIGKNLGRLFNR